MGPVGGRSQRGRRRSGTLFSRSLMPGVAVFLAVVVTACGGGRQPNSELGTRGEGYIVVGSGDSVESQLMASLYAQAASTRKRVVIRELHLGSDAMAFRALRKGAVDLVPQPLGALTDELGGTPRADREDARRALERVLPNGLRVLDPSRVERRYALVVTDETAEDHGLDRVADLARTALVIGGPPGCLTSISCLPDLVGALGPEVAARFRPLDDGGWRTKEALRSGEVDVAVLPSSDAAIETMRWVRLEEGDRQLAPSAAFAPVMREELVDDRVRRRLDDISEELSDAAFRAMVQRVTLRQDDPQNVASDYLQAKARDEI